MAEGWGGGTYLHGDRPFGREEGEESAEYGCVLVISPGVHTCLQASSVRCIIPGARSGRKERENPCVDHGRDYAIHALST